MLLLTIMIKANNNENLSISQKARLPRNAHNPEANEPPCDWLSARRGERRARPSVRFADWWRAALSCQLIGWGGGGKDGGAEGPRLRGREGRGGSGCRSFRLAEHTEEAKPRCRCVGWAGAVPVVSECLLPSERQSSSARVELIAARRSSALSRALPPPQGQTGFGVGLL